jgi:tRNA pseudouridine38-40 synthase
MRAEFHARYSAVSRSYRYLVGTDADAESPFRAPFELAWRRPLDIRVLGEGANLIIGDHCFRGFAVKGTAPETDDHRCVVREASWAERDGGLSFSITANRFLHHMVRFLVGTMLDVATGKRDLAVIRELLEAGDNREVSPPAPPHALYLANVEYPRELYLAAA